MVEFLVDKNSGIAGKKFKLILNVHFQSCFFHDIFDQVL